MTVPRPVAVRSPGLAGVGELRTEAREADPTDSEAR